MPTQGKIKAIVLAWLVAEILALAVAVRFLGWPMTLALGLGASIAGMYVMRRAGRDSLGALRNALNGRSGSTIIAPSHSLLRMASGLLLIIPGVLSDMIGLALLVPALRGLVLGRIAPSVRSAPPGVIDLGPDEWRGGLDPDRNAPCEQGPGVLPGEPKSAFSRRRDHE